MNPRILNLTFISFLIVTLLTLNSCSKDDPLSPADDHFEAEGMVFYESGIKIVEIFRGVTQDTFFVSANSKTAGIEAKFLNPERKEIDPPDYKEKPLAWEIQDTSIVSVWQHDGEEGSYEFHLAGKKHGTTQIEFFILHEGHPDFRSGKIPVKVLMSR